MKLKNKIAIVTGGSRGIGFAIVEKFLEEGAKVAICGSRIETASAAVDRILEKDPDAQVLGVSASMSSAEEIESLFKTVVKQWGYVDVLVNNAGISDAKAIDEMSDEDFTNVMEVNVNGVFRCTREATKIMKQKGGSIINTSSMITLNGSRNRQTAYTASKFAVNGLTRTCARELGEFNIRVNAVAPGVVGTDMVAASVTEQKMRGLKSCTALQRIAKPEEMAGAYVYLASDEASFTSGAILSVDGCIVM